LNHIGPDVLGKIRADINAGTSPVAAFDRYIDARHHDAINLAARIATPLNASTPTDPKP
jgi:hypothetical protein